VTSIDDLIDAESRASDRIGGKLGRFVLALQVSWRPMFAYQTIIECTVMALIAAHSILTHDIAMLE
jgi:hypothetical protein